MLIPLSKCSILNPGYSLTFSGQVFSIFCKSFEPLLVEIVMVGHQGNPKKVKVIRCVATHNPILKKQPSNSEKLQKLLGSLLMFNAFLCSLL